MDEQKLNEAAEKYAGISEDKFANKSKKYDAFDLQSAFDSGARWHEQQNPWRKVEDELPDPMIGWDGDTDLVIAKDEAGAKDTAFFNYIENRWLGTTLHVTEWKYIE